jgi:gamma-glutamyltranspeptidase / glutathione hydrolase
MGREVGPALRFAAERRADSAGGVLKRVAPVPTVCLESMRSPESHTRSQRRRSDRLGARGLRCVGLLLVLAGCQSAPGAPEPSAALPRLHAVVAEHPLAVAAGLEILDQGGNAFDAAVATALALAVVYPQAGNLGGGGFALCVPGGSELKPVALDFRETAPAELSNLDFLDATGVLVSERALESHLAAGIPGTPAGLDALHTRFGRLPRSEVCAPALRLAREGFKVDAFLARDLKSTDLERRLAKNSAARALYYPGGQGLAVGQVFRQPELARTLEQYAQAGAAGFYTGPVAEALTAEMRRGRGKLAHADLAGYQVQWLEPLRGSFRGRQVLTMPPPSSGGLVLLQALAVLEGLPLEAERRTQPAPPPGSSVGLTPRVLHWWIEILRRGFADRAEHLGDPAFVAAPVEALLSAAWIAERRTSIGERASPNVLPMGVPDRENGETTHLCVVDREGNAVSLTTSLNTTFGSGILVPGAGFLLNNHIDDFALAPGTPNAYGLVGNAANALVPGKRPLSSMAPTVLLRDDGSLELVLGSPGGPRIISALFQVLARHLLHGESLESAVLAPRLHQQWRPVATLFEPGWPTEVLQALSDRGHAVEISAQRWASVQAIQVLPRGGVIAVSDPRRGGVAGLSDRLLPEPALPGEQNVMF